MPARIRKIRHDEDTRLRIKVGNIINRLQKCIDGTVTLTSEQIRCAQILLAKALPDLTSVEHSGEVQKTYVVRMPGNPADLTEWHKQYAPNQPTTVN